jgi:S1-C subfamily serine protease
MILRSTILVLFMCVLPAFARAAETGDGVAIAKKLSAATVTVRLSSAEAKKGEPVDVTVYSGVSLGKGLIVTFSSAPVSSRYRFTLPDGAQAEGEVRVIDHYSGLRLLEMSKRDLPGLALADEVPPVGSTLYTAAAAGIEKPVVSRGILGGIDRKYSGRELPPLLQCDVRTTDTSPGAAIVDSEGRLVGIIAVNSLSGQGDGWTYAVPLQHIVRLQNAYARGKVIELRRQRPVLGMRMIGDGKSGEMVMVEHVTPGGPADKAGIRKGDQILQVKGQQVRNAYQVVNEVIKLEGGTELPLTVNQAGKVKQMRVTLGEGEVVRSSLRADDGLTIEVDPDGKGGRIVPRREGDKPQNQQDPRAGAGVEAARAKSVPRDGAGMLDEQVRRIFVYLDLLQKENKSLKEQNDVLKREVKELKESLQGEQKKAR